MQKSNNLNENITFYHQGRSNGSIKMKVKRKQIGPASKWQTGKKGFHNQEPKQS